jgi:two-component system phosphate regulon sensor histidine kinase PhoR
LVKPEEIYRCLAQHTADGLVISNSQGVIASCNPAVLKLVNQTEQNLIGQKISAIMDAEGFPPAVATSASKDKPKSTGSGGGKNGGEAVADYAPKPVNIFSRGGVDMTMNVSHIPIPFEDGESGYLTVIYIVQANSVQQAQTEFVSTVSHELRTPLTSIKGFADTILRSGDKIEATQQRRYIGIIKDQADRLTRLVEDLLAVSRLESKKMQLTIRALELNETVQRVIRNLSDKGRNHKITNKIPSGLPHVWADADRLEQILTNLIDNAIKYSPPKTTVTVSARDVEGTTEMVEFSVSDEGVGIPQEHLPQIFTKFGRLDNPLVRQTEGTGLGLYITRSLVLALGGQITVTSEPGKTTFTVQLPAATFEDQATRGRD